MCRCKIVTLGKCCFFCFFFWFGKKMRIGVFIQILKRVEWGVYCFYPNRGLKRPGGEWSHWRAHPPPPHAPVTKEGRGCSRGRGRCFLFLWQGAQCLILPKKKKSSQSKLNPSQLKMLVFLLLQMGLELITRKVKLPFCAKFSVLERHHEANLL